MQWKKWKTWQWLALALALLAFAALKVFLIFGGENQALISKKQQKCADLQQICQIDGVKLHADRKIEHSKPFLLIAEADFTPEEVRFTMEGMDMGHIAYRFSPVPNRPNHWQAEVILPVCATARVDWLLHIPRPNVLGKTMLEVAFIVD